MNNAERERERETINTYLLEDFKSEINGLHPFLTKHFSDIFPNCVLLKDEFSIPNGGNVDALAFCPNKKGKWGNLVLAEYKWENEIKKGKESNNSINEVIAYFSNLIKSKGYEVWEEYGEYLKKERKADGKHKSIEKNPKNKLWKNPILLCVANFGYFDKLHELSHLEAKYAKAIILVEVQKYENSETKSILIHSVKGEYQRLGISSKKIIIQIPKEEGEPLVKHKKEKDNNVKVKEELDINNFLKIRGAAEWNKEKILEIDRDIELFDNQIERKGAQFIKGEYLFFDYRKNNKSLLWIYLWKTITKGFKIYLLKNKITSDWDKNDNRGSAMKRFERQIIIKNERTYESFFKKLKNYLKTIGEDLGV